MRMKVKWKKKIKWRNGKIRLIKDVMIISKRNLCEGDDEEKKMKENIERKRKKRWINDSIIERKNGEEKG